MSRRYVLSTAASDDLFRIWSWGVDRFGLAQANRYQDSLLDLCDLLADFPEMGRRIDGAPEILRFAIRDAHVIVYRPTSEPIDIIRVMAMRQNWADMLTDRRDV